MDLFCWPQCFCCPIVYIPHTNSFMFLESLLPSYLQSSSDKSHTCSGMHTHIHSTLRGTLNIHRTRGLLVQDMESVSASSIFVPVILFPCSSVKLMPSSTFMTYPGMLHNLRICLWGEGTCKEVISVLSALHGELSDVNMCSLFSYHFGEVNSANHVSFPVFSFQE